MIELDLDAYAKAVGAEFDDLIDPIPSCALAAGPIRFTPFRLMEPRGDGVYVATFVITEYVRVTGGFVRYGEFDPILLPVSNPKNAQPDDILHLELYTHRAPTGIRPITPLR